MPTVKLASPWTQQLVFSPLISVPIWSCLRSTCVDIKCVCCCVPAFCCCCTDLWSASVCGEKQIIIWLRNSQICSGQRPVYLLHHLTHWYHCQTPCCLSGSSWKITALNSQGIWKKKWPITHWEWPFRYSLLSLSLQSNDCVIILNIWRVCQSWSSVAQKQTYSPRRLYAMWAWSRFQWALVRIQPLALCCMS